MKALPWIKILLWVARLSVGLLFIVSGLIKINDPLGFSYKLDEYYTVFGHYKLLAFFDSGLFHNTTLQLSVFLSVLEITLGIALLVGAWRKITVTVLLALIVFFTFL